MLFKGNIFKVPCSYNDIEILSVVVHCFSVNSACTYFQDCFLWLSFNDSNSSIIMLARWQGSEINGTDYKSLIQMAVEVVYSGQSD
jgi:hypothetical protein